MPSAMAIDLQQLHEPNEHIARVERQHALQQLADVCPLDRVTGIKNKTSILNHSSLHCICTQQVRVQVQYKNTRANLPTQEPLDAFVCAGERQVRRETNEERAKPAVQSAVFFCACGRPVVRDGGVCKEFARGTLQASFAQGVEDGLRKEFCKSLRSCKLRERVFNYIQLI